MTHELSDYQKFIHQRTYARYLPEKRRRETWEETVHRYGEFLLEKLPRDLPASLFDQFNQAITAVRHMDIMPSMRLMHSAGPAAELENLCGYNCGYVPIDSPKAFSELLYVLMCGTGCGFSVEHQYIRRIPLVPVWKTSESPVTITVEDSREGWALALNESLNHLWNGISIQLDVTKVRPKGAILKTFGGRASGPEPLVELVTFIQETLRDVSVRPTGMIKPIEAYDIACKIAQCVIAGGVRRSATICLFSETDEEMLTSKTEAALTNNPWRSYSNNSVVTHDPSISYLKGLMDLARTTGEPGIFNRDAAIRKAHARFRETWDYGCNPCGEIILRPRQLCNLTEVVCRPEDTIDTLETKVILATILGTIQSTFTKFNHKVLSEDWRVNSEEERLLGVSLTGIMDCYVVRSAESLDVLKRTAHLTNASWACALGINRSKSITCVKPSGTVSQLVGSASGIHSRHAPYYLRSVQVSKTDPLAKLMIDQKVPHITDDFSGDPVFQFPIKSPNSTYPSLGWRMVFNRMFQEYWCDHNVSQTFTLGEPEWPEFQSWLIEKFDRIVGITMFPEDSNKDFRQWTPYKAISIFQFSELILKFPKIDFSKLPEYETEDNTEGAKEYACVGGSCSL